MNAQSRGFGMEQVIRIYPSLMHALVVCFGSSDLFADCGNRSYVGALVTGPTQVLETKGARP
ncbi:hypothetical protein Aam_022_009 [Acidocella aminolytica 101 = DSM 11237]|uniref:Uncharacterized protein n=1 Tax=Acidocella aminolytica 101 = DSM 11237 TaxID=1120923 RepID=A0A0D6PCX0_9PROT|nr:hypothetical protein Aam_022_009 [Acidocella aminolytica 101 = DSM 11237]GBQ32637.1 hypothetical protein AA11237_0204 [Acidocella aminolytica 101 = DSM 11237]